MCVVVLVKGISVTAAEAGAACADAVLSSKSSSFSSNQGCQIGHLVANLRSQSGYLQSSAIIHSLLWPKNTTFLK